MTESGKPELPETTRVYRASLTYAVPGVVGVLFAALGLAFGAAGSLALALVFCGIGCLFVWSSVALMSARLFVDATGIVRKSGLPPRRPFAVTWSEIESFRLTQETLEPLFIRAINLSVSGRKRAIQISDAEVSDPGIEKLVEQLRARSVREDEPRQC